MSTNLPIQLSDHTFQALASAAVNVGKTPAELAADVVERTYGSTPSKVDPRVARAEFERCFGSIDIGTPVGVANDEIDRDLARIYQSSVGPQ
jgi:hypothetical protein